VFVRLAVVSWIRPHLMTARVRAVALNPARTGFGTTNGGPYTLQADPPKIPNAWVLSTHIVDKSGHGLTPQFLAKTCPKLAAAGPPKLAGPGVRTQAPPDVQNTLGKCVAKVATKYHTAMSYQPAGRYWTFQFYELALFLAGALALAGFCFWWIRRRLA
jgi:hypothetical protein